MNIIKKILVAGVISLFVPASSFAEKVKIGDPGWTVHIHNLLQALEYLHLQVRAVLWNLHLVL